MTYFHNYWDLDQSHWSKGSYLGFLLKSKLILLEADSLQSFFLFIYAIETLWLIWVVEKNDNNNHCLRLWFCKEYNSDNIRSPAILRIFKKVILLHREEEKALLGIGKKQTTANLLHFSFPLSSRSGSKQAPIDEFGVPLSSDTVLLSSRGQ